MSNDAPLSPLDYILELRAGSFVIREVRGEEAISQPFRFDVWARRDSGATPLPAPDVIVGDTACLVMRRGLEHLRRVRGIVTRAVLEGTTSGEPELHVVIEPRWVRARYRKDTRAYRDMTVPEIVLEALERAGVQVEARLGDDYPTRPYTVQHQETDFDFVTRLLEEEGIHYYFVEDPLGVIDETEEPPILLLADSAESYEPIVGDAEVPFLPGKGLIAKTEAFYELGDRAELAPSAITVRDFYLRTPRLDLTATAEGPCSAGRELYDYPGKHETPAQGARVASLWAEAARHESEAFHGLATCARLAPGHRFELVDAPDALPDGDQVVLTVSHRWVRDEEPYRSEATFMSADNTYRPPRRTEVPRQEAVLTGVVTGPEGADIHCNDLGHVKVHFPWDRQQPKDDDCSDWVPVMQDNTGTSASIPRVGWEVACQFVEGDPDRPVVLGRTYNGQQPYPTVLPDGKTRTALKALTSPVAGVSTVNSGKGAHSDTLNTVPANEIVFEDAAGAELIYVQAQRDLNAVVAHDKKETVLHDETHQVTGDETVELGHDHTVVVGHDRSLNVRGDQQLTVDGNRSRKVGENQQVDIVGDRITTIGVTHKRGIATTDNVTTADLSERIGALNLEASLAENKTTAGLIQTFTVGGAVLEASVKEKEESVDQLRVETVGGLLFTGTTKHIEIDAGISRTTTVGGAHQVAGMKHVLYQSDVALTQTVAGAIAYASPGAINIRTAASSLTLAARTVSLSGKEVFIKGTKIELKNPTAHFN